MRRYSDPIEVRSEKGSQLPSELASELPPGLASELAPKAFVWRGRLYVVRSVLSHWRERRPWWREALDPAPGQPTGIDIASREQQVWRVEASPGRVHGSGVFDLAHDLVPHDPVSHDPVSHGQTGWRLVRVAD